jgi:HEAT repeat protein
LTVLDRGAVQALKRAAADRDPEVARRARACLEVIEARTPSQLTPVVVRTLLRRRTGGGVEMLVRYLPYASHDNAEETVCFGLEERTAAAGRVGPALAKAIDDPVAARRALAACLAGRWGDAGQRAAARRRLTDDDPLVRLRAAQGLLAGKDRAALPVLLDLLDVPSLDAALQAEALLRCAAGNDAPAVFGGTEKEWKEVTRSWRQWWADHGERLDLGVLGRERRRPRLLLVGHTSHLSLFGSDSKEHWQLREMRKADETYPTAGDRRLLTALGVDVADTVDRVRIHFFGQEHPRQVKGNAPELKVYGRMVLVADRSGREIDRLTPAPLRMSAVVLLDDGNLLLGGEMPESKGCLVELDPAGRIVWEAWAPLAPALLWDCRPLLRLGFRDLGPADWDLDSFASRRAQLRDPSPLVRFRAACALHRRELETAVALPLFVDLLDDADESVRQEAVWKLRSLGRAAVPALTVAARERGTTGRVAALDLLATLCERPEMEPHLLGAMRDRDAVVRRRAAELLGHPAFADRALAALVAALRDTDPSVVAAAIDSVGTFGVRAKAAVPDLMRFAKGDTPHAAPAARALVQVGLDAEKAVPILTALLKDRRKPGNRRFVIEALGQIGPAAKDVVPLLAESLKDPRFEEAWETLEALQRIGVVTPDVSAALADVVQSKRPADVRAEAAVTLGRMGPRAKDALPALRAVVGDMKVNDEPWPVSYAVWRIEGKWPGKACSPPAPRPPVPPRPPRAP